MTDVLSPESKTEVNAPTPPVRNAPRYVKVLLALHIACISIWAMPIAPPEQVDGRVRPPVFDLGDWLRIWNTRYLRNLPPIDSYLFESGAWQYWDMFSPNPSQQDRWVDAEIIYKDGSHKYYLYPRMYTLPIPNKYAQERYRKYLERASTPEYPWVMPQFALRVAYLNDNPKNPPWTVRLTRHLLDIVPPGKPQPTEYRSELYFDYAVDQRALARMRAESR